MPGASATPVVSIRSKPLTRAAFKRAIVWACAPLAVRMSKGEPPIREAVPINSTIRQLEHTVLDQKGKPVRQVDPVIRSLIRNAPGVVPRWMARNMGAILLTGSGTKKSFFPVEFMLKYEKDRTLDKK
jgi:hypothetical protein